MHMFMPSEARPPDTSVKVLVCDGPVCRWHHGDLQVYRDAAEEAGADLR